MNTLIVDDDKSTQDIIESFAQKTKMVNCVKICSSAVDASNIILNEKIDLLFLDVLMPEINGIELINSLNGTAPQAIMISSNEKFAQDAFTLNVTDFLVKPITYARFLKAITKAKKNYDNNSENTSAENIFIKVNSRLLKINLKDIFMVEAMADYVAVHTPEKRYIVHSTMKAIENKLSSTDFARVHNSYLVRLDKISEIEDGTLVVNKKLIPVSKSHRKDLMNRLKLL